MLDIAFAEPFLPKSGALVLLIFEGGPKDTVREVDAATNGAITRALAASDFKGRHAQSVTILAPGGGFDRVIAIGLGKADALTPLLAEQAGGAAAAALARQAAAVIAAGALAPDLAAAIAMGATLRTYRFDRYRTTEKPEEKPRLVRITVHTADPAKARAAWDTLRPVAEGVFLSRDLVSEPPNVLNPAELATRCKALEKRGAKVEIFGPKDMARLGFGALLGVSHGSANEPRMVVMRWMGASGSRKSKSKPLCFIGKGVTFDTGGISIKPAGGMEDMKWDMAGAGAVIGLMAALAGRKAKVDAIGIVGLVENMPDGAAQRPGDVVRTYSGKTVEIINTDAEGRLVLADVLWYCQQKFDPRFMIDLATLTGAIIVGLGHEYAGMFSNNDTLSEQLRAAGETCGEKLWRMPLHKNFEKDIKSAIADIKNVGGRAAGASMGAQFIQHFVNDRPWAHLDIAGMAWSGKDAPTTPKGATAFGVRLLNQLVADQFE